jgi:hypothetical protein
MEENERGHIEKVNMPHLIRSYSWKQILFTSACGNCLSVLQNDMIQHISSSFHAMERYTATGSKFCSNFFYNLYFIESYSSKCSL